jgi:hypothetical protein
MWHTLTNHPAHQQNADGKDSSSTKDDKKPDDQKKSNDPETK